MKKNVLLIGSGGSEHSLAWKLAQSRRTGKLFVASGNGGTQLIAQNVPIDATDVAKLLEFAQTNQIDLTIVGPDDPLALGIVDAFQAKGLRIFGPTKSAAEIEWSKSFSKKLMNDGGIPTAKFEVFKEHAKALDYVRSQHLPIVIKASGLALGKGVYVCNTLNEAEMALSEIMLEQVHKDAGNEVIIEEFLDGPEISIHALSDGNTFKLFPPSQDHKPIGEGNVGKNTGGMGTIAPISWITTGNMREINKRIVIPTLDALSNMGRPFTGLLYPGLKMATEGPKVLEFNARFGDPETQSYMRLLKTDLLDIVEAGVEGTLSEINLEWHPGFAVCVVLASGGYPDEYKKGFPISGIEKAEKVSGVIIFHAGTTFSDKLVTSGGRVLGVTAVGDTLQDALNRAYRAISFIHFEGMQYRRDIGRSNGE